MIDQNPISDVWQLLNDKHWQYLPFNEGYQSPCGKFFITQGKCYHIPGDIIYFLKTGHIRNGDIFDTGWFKPEAKDLGYRAHKNGRWVKLERIK